MMKNVCRLALLACAAFSATTFAAAPQSAASANQGSSETLLWKVTSPHRTLFLAGEVLVLSSKDYPLPAPMTKAFSQPGELITEGAQASNNPTEVQHLIHKLGVLPKGKTLGDVLTSDQLALVKQASNDFALPFGNIAHIRSWLAFIVLRNAAYAKYGINPKQQLGPHLYAAAEQKQMPTSALESATQQLEMFAAIPAAQQATWLAMTAKELLELPSTRASIVRAWRTGDTAALSRLSHKRFMGHPGLYTLLASDRNQRWARALDKLLATDGKPAFVVVGAGHFFGPSNLLDLLRAKGFTITQL